MVPKGLCWCLKFPVHAQNLRNQFPETLTGNMITVISTQKLDWLAIMISRWGWIIHQCHHLESCSHRAAQKHSASVTSYNYFLILKELISSSGAVPWTEGSLRLLNSLMAFYIMNSGMALKRYLNDTTMSSISIVGWVFSFRTCTHILWGKVAI